jgi:hypothetical protein
MTNEDIAAPGADVAEDVKQYEAYRLDYKARAQALDGEQLAKLIDGTKARIADCFVNKADLREAKLGAELKALEDKDADELTWISAHFYLSLIEHQALGLMLDLRYAEEEEERRSNEQFKKKLYLAIMQEAPYTYEDTSTGDLLQLLEDALYTIEDLERKLAHKSAPKQRPL